MDERFKEDSCAWSAPEGAPKLEDPGENCPALVREHALRPRNFGEMSPGLADGYALLDDPSCGDKIELWLMVEEGRIFEIRFKSNGCASTIAINSMLTELAAGKTIAEAKAISNGDIEAAFQGGIEITSGCPLAGIKALQLAIADFESKRN